MLEISLPTNYGVASYTWKAFLKTGNTQLDFIKCNGLTFLLENNTRGEVSSVVGDSFEVNGSKQFV